MRGVLLSDWDGVFWDSFEATYKKVCRIFGKRGLTPPKANEYRKEYEANFLAFYISHGVLDEKEVLIKEWAEYSGEYQSKGLFPGTRFFLNDLFRRNVAMGLLSSEQEGILRRNLAGEGLYNKFAYIHPEAHDRSGAIRKAMDYFKLAHWPESVLYVDDSPKNILEAKRLGVRLIGVTYGYGLPEEMAKTGVILANSPQELHQLVYKEIREGKL